MMNEIQWGDLVRQRRRSMNMTQEQLANRAGVSQVQVGRIERYIVEPGVCVKIAGALNMRVSHLLGELPSIDAFIALRCDARYVIKLAEHLRSRDIVEACYVSQNSTERYGIVVKVSNPLFQEISKFILDDCIYMRIDKSVTGVVLKRYGQSKSNLVSKGGVKLVHGIIFLTVDYDRQEAAGSDIARIEGVEGCYAITGEADIIVHCSSSSNTDVRQTIDRIERIPGTNTDLKLENLIAV